MLKKIALFFLILISHFLFPTSVFAVCPVCTVAVGAGLGISRALGIDDAVTSVWIGGLTLSMSFWLIDWIEKRRKAKLTFNFSFLTIILMYAFVLIPLWYGKYIGRANNTLWGMDKILFGTSVGSIVFLGGMWADKKVRQLKGKQLFVYQKVVFPLVSLVIMSLILHLVTT